jgi:hypothetical protein
MLPQFLLFLLIPSTIAISYSSFVSISTRKIKPNLSSYFIWFSTNLIAFVGGLVKGAALLDVINILLSVLMLGFIILLSITYRQFYIDTTNTDKGCLILGLIGMIFLLFVSDKNFAIALAILVDFIAVIPTIFKVWFNPKESDDFWRFSISCAMKIISLLIITSFTFANSGFTIYAMLITFIISISILIKNNTVKLLPKNKIS